MTMTMHVGFIPPIEVERPSCPWPNKNAWNQADAEAVMAAMRRRGSRDVAAYRCSGCGYWHIGKNDALLRKRARRTLNRAKYRKAGRSKANRR
jgi:hypothetical protein